MAKPMTAAQFVTALKNEGVKVSEYGSWRTHNRNHKGAWGEVHGVVIHHTAGVGSGMLPFCYNGNASLPGPLCHSFLSKAATVHMVGHGRANHCGTMAENAFQAMLKETKTKPRPSASEPRDGNRHTYGIEIENRGDGKDFYPSAQYDQAVRWAAAICRFHKWNSGSVIGHKEATTRKIDPKGPIGSASGKQWDMDQFRRDVQAQLDGKPAPKPTDPPKYGYPGRKPKSLQVSGFAPELKHGDEGWWVGWLQRNLNRFDGVSIKVTNKYDDATAKAVHGWYQRELDFTTTTGGKVFGAGGWRRVLSLHKGTKGSKK